MRVVPHLILLPTVVVQSLRPSQYGTGVPNTNPPPNRGYNNPNNPNNASNRQQHQNGSPIQRNQRNEEEEDFENYPATSYETGGNSFDTQESVEERLASWRAMQQERFEGQNPTEELNPRDEEGRLKLLATVSRGSISVFFFVLMWRSVHHFELADQAFRKSPTTRLIFVVPTVLLFIGNMAGCVATIMTRTLKSKKRMKAVLNLNKLVELSLFAYNVVRMGLVNKLVPREIYVGRSITNFLFIVQCQLFTRVTWDAAQVTQGTTMPNGPRTTSQQHGGRGEQSYDETGEGYSRTNDNNNNFDYDVDNNNDVRYSDHHQRDVPNYVDDVNDEWDDHRQRWND